MRLALKTSGLCATGMFLLVTYTAILRQSEPWDVLMVAVPAAVMTGVLGYIIGDILSKPRGNRRRSRGGKPAGGEAQSSAPPEAPVTGEETFLDDLEPDPVAETPSGEAQDEVPEENNP